MLLPHPNQCQLGGALGSPKPRGAPGGTPRTSAPELGSKPSAFAFRDHVAQPERQCSAPIRPRQRRVHPAGSTPVVRDTTANHGTSHCPPRPRRCCPEHAGCLPQSIAEELGHEPCVHRRDGASEQLLRASPTRPDLQALGARPPGTLERACGVYGPLRLGGAPRTSAVDAGCWAGFGLRASKPSLRRLKNCCCANSVSQTRTLRVADPNGARMPSRHSGCDAR